MKIVVKEKSAGGSKSLPNEGEAVLLAELSKTLRPKGSARISLAPWKTSARLLVLINNYDNWVHRNCEQYFTDFHSNLFPCVSSSWPDDLQAHFQLSTHLSF